MFDKLIEILELIWDYIVPYIIIMEYQEGVILRFGIFKKVITKGLHFKIPFADYVMVENTVITTTQLPPQSLTTKDEKTIVVKGMVKYQIEDVKMYCLSVWDAKEVIIDTSCGIIRETINERDWNELKDGKIDGLISRRVTSALSKYGIKVEWVTLTDMAIMKSFRLFTERNLIE